MAKFAQEAEELGCLCSSGCNGLKRRYTIVKRRFEIDAEGYPNLPGMMLVTVEALKDLGGSATVQELDERRSNSRA